MERNGADAYRANFPAQDYTHLWRWSGLVHATIRWEFIGPALCLASDAVISFGYWTTDFLVVQRVLAAKDLRSRQDGADHRRGVQDVVPFIVILPGLLALAVLPDQAGSGESAAVATGAHSYNEVLPLMLARYCGPGSAGLGITALIAGFMSGMAGNVSAFATVWTYDIYRRLFNKKPLTDAHYVSMGRWCTVIGVLGQHRNGIPGDAVRSASWTTCRRCSASFIAPLFGTVILGMLWKRATPARRVLGFAGGTVSLDRHVGVGENRSVGAPIYRALAARQSPWRRTCIARLWSWIDLRGRDSSGEHGDQAKAAKSNWQGWFTAQTEIPSMRDVSALSAADFLGGRGGAWFSSC